MELTHFDEAGNARMVDVSEKAVTARTAVAEGYISVNAEIYERIKAGTMKKAMFWRWLNWRRLWAPRKHRI